MMFGVFINLKSIFLSLVIFMVNLVLVIMSFFGLYLKKWVVIFVVS